MSDTSTERPPRPAAAVAPQGDGTPVAPQGDGTPLAEFAWSDRVVGMGYFPDEVVLPPDWTWTVHAPQARAA